jgi:hypothetical protein
MVEMHNVGTVIRMLSYMMLRRVAPERTDVSEGCIASIIRVARICELGTLAVTRNLRKLRRNTVY